MIDNRKLKIICYAIIISSLMVFVISIPLTHYESLRLYLWKPGSPFTDFFTLIKGNIYWNKDLRYDTDIYPPLPNLIFSIVSMCIPADTLKAVIDGKYLDMLTMQELVIPFLICVIIAIFLYVNAVQTWKKGSKAEKTIFSFCTLFMAPFLACYERGNIIFFAMVFTLIFFMWKDSDNKILREIGFISLAIAAGLKIYPAIFGFLLVREKRFKEAFRLVIYGILAFVLPCFYYGGILEVTTKMIHNLIYASGYFGDSRIGYSLNFQNTVRDMFSGFVGIYSLFIASWTYKILAIFGFLSIFLVKGKWRIVLLTTCLLIGIPGISNFYSGIFMVIPLIAFLDSDEKRTWIDVVYLLLILATLIEIPFCWKETGGDIYYTYLHITTPLRFESVSLVLMTILLIIEGIVGLLRKSKVAAIGLLVLSLVTIPVTGYLSYGCLDSPYAFTNYLTYVVKSALKVKNGQTVRQSFTMHRDILNSIVIRLKPPEEGEVTVSIVDPEKEEVLFSSTYDASQLILGYNVVDTGDLKLKKGHQYELAVTCNLKDDCVLKIYRTIENLEMGDEYMMKDYLTKDSKKLDGALGIELFESNE